MRIGLCRRRRMLLVALAVWALTTCLLVVTNPRSSSSPQPTKPMVPTPPAWPTVSQNDASGLPDLRQYVRLLNVDIRRFGDSFDPRINESEIMGTINLLWQVDKLLRDNDLVYFIYGSTLLGSYRHHGFVPWDDDVDIMMPVEQKDRLLKAVLMHKTDLRVFAWSRHWKLWSYSRRVTADLNYGWPFIDVFFYRENDTHIVDTDRQYSKLFTLPREYVFPLHARPFMGRWLPSPRDAARFLASTVFDPDGCHSPYYLHNKEKKPRESKVARCQRLAHRYPFVLRSTTDDGCLAESLYTGSRRHYTVRVQEPANSLTFNYTVRLVNSTGITYADDRI